MCENSSTAGSGVRKVGMPAPLNSRRASRTCSSPIQQVTTGLSVLRAVSITTRAACVGSVIACGVRITITPSIWSSSRQVWSAAA